MDHILISEKMNEFENYLYREERAESTIQKYVRDLELFYQWGAGRIVTKELIAEWKESLYQSGCSPVTINSALAAVHSFLKFMGWEECRVKYLKIQRQVFRDASKDLNKSEYERLVSCARKHKKERLALIMETIGATGIRVSEVKYITVDAVKKGRADISLKGKIRTILLPGKLTRKLQKYAKKQKIASGELFVTASGKGISRKQIWHEMKCLCKEAGVDETKVFPHNLRHLFARVFYKSCQDIVCLADVLGHSSIETTRIYLVTTGAEYARRLDRLGFVS